tara:strand:- start:117 stop:317 length:201 start_codon:yes stop_codon:yes gene_type:complete
VEELEDLFHKVRGFNASCRMTSEQKEGYDLLNKLYNELSDSNINHSVCSKGTLLKKVENFIQCKKK